MFSNEAPLLWYNIKVIIKSCFFFFQASPKQEIAKQNGKHSSTWAVDSHKVEDDSLEKNAANIPGVQTEATKMMSPVVQTDYLHSHNKSKVKDDVDVIQTDNAATISHTTEKSKQVSLEQEGTGIGPNVTESEVSVTAWSERQLSEEVQRTTELVRNLSSKEEETAGHVLVLNEQVQGIEMEVEKLKENVELMHQDSISKLFCLLQSSLGYIYTANRSVLAYIA